MRRLVVVGIVAALALSLAGCGGGGSQTASSQQSGSVAVQTKAPGGSSGASSIAAASTPTSDTLSPQEPQLFVAFPTGAEVVPEVIRQRLDARQPMLIYFYDSAQTTSVDQSASIAAALADYRGLIDLVSFDTGKYVTTDESGTVTVAPGMEKDAVAQQVANLLGADQLNVKFTPYIVFVDRQGYITYRFRGPVDSAILEREVLRATE